MINTEIFRQIGLDSGALTQLGAIVHPIAEPGEYEAVIRRGDRHHGEVRFTVGDGGATQLDIDAAAAALSLPDDGCGCSGDKAESALLTPGGHLLIHVGDGGRYSVAVKKWTAFKGRRDGVRFDTRELDAGDLFAATVLRPGMYTVTNTATGAAGRLEVAYPEPGEAPFRPPDAVRIRVGAEFEPAEYSVAAGQGQLFELTSPARIVIELVEPYDRDQKPAKYRHRLTTP